MRFKRKYRAEIISVVPKSRTYGTVDLQKRDLKTYRAKKKSSTKRRIIIICGKPKTRYVYSVDFDNN